ncbi:putative terminase, partial [Vibrio phage 242E40-1]
MATTGRPTKYKPEYCIQAEKLCRKGFIDTEIADFFEVDVSTLNRWKEAHPEFRESLKSGKSHSDAKVVDALYNRALGYEFEEIKEESEGGAITKTTRTVKKQAGDTTAQIFWLKNRQPEMWRDKTETKVTLTDNFDDLLNDAV